MRFQVDGQNVINVVNVINFGGLFSENAIGPSRSFCGSQQISKARLFRPTTK